jgi:hypothetical protein
MHVSFFTSSEYLNFALPLPTGPGEGEAPPIDVIRVGTFTDMNKKTVTITHEDLDAFISNHAANMAGQDVPVDVDHRRQEAAGWIVRLFRDGNVLRAVPRWNAHGARLVGDQMYRYISATINLAQKTIISVSLTNFPAVKNLSPVALSEFPADVVEDPAPANSDELCLLFTERTEPMTINRNTQVVAADAVVTEQAGAAADSAAAAAAATTPTPVVDVAAELAAVRQAMQTELAAAMTQFRTELTNAAALSEQQRLTIIQEVVGGMREEQAVADFSMTVTGTGRYALPLRSDDLRQRLMNIPQPHRGAVMEILRTVHGSGTVDFSETGTSQGQDAALLTLDKPSSDMLRLFMKDGGTVAQFFELNADLLGAQSQYDLRAFTAAA